MTKRTGIRISDLIEADDTRNKIGRQHQNNLDHNYNKELYEKGTEWALNKRDIEDAGEFAENKSFLNGYARGLRLLIIEHYSENSPLKR